MFFSGVFSLVRNSAWVLAIFAVIADAASTEKALTENQNAYEANPLMAPVVEAGQLWPFTFLMCAAIFFFAKPLWKPNPRQDVTFLWLCFLGVAVFRFLVVANNLQVAAGY